MLTSPGEGPRTGVWILEGISLAGKSTALRAWRAAAPAVLWSAEDLATQRLFEPLEAAHRPGAVEPWLEALLGAWEALAARGAGAWWGAGDLPFAAHQERFHLSAGLEGGLGPGALEALERRLAALGARGALFTLSPAALEARMEASLAARPATWEAWLRRRWGSLGAAREALLGQQEAFRRLAAASALPWELHESP